MTISFLLGWSGGVSTRGDVFSGRNVVIKTQYDILGVAKQMIGVRKECLHQSSIVSPIKLSCLVGSIITRDSCSSSCSPQSRNEMESLFPSHGHRYFFHNRLSLKIACDTTSTFRYHLDRHPQLYSSTKKEYPSLNSNFYQIHQGHVSHVVVVVAKHRQRKRSQR